ncbi:plastocyanin [Ideonella azotifigens]|uniref:Plastocyanin n=1 Tax=Ideonella azotifigens TaxID=513160 RepID=A0ABN1JNV0_9BURK|nr:plastocyanin [Ideonella azotifigens]MCD2339862.1 plastocyanin [Ideonella azotifigens]
MNARFPRLSFAGLLLGAALSAAQAASMTVRVVDTTGQPVPDVAVVVSSRSKPGRASPVPTVEIAQQGVRFVPAMVIVTPGTKIKLTNRDSFDHHVRGTEGQSFEFRIAGADANKPPAASPEVVLQGGAGPIQLGCYLHSRMQASIYVAESPWYGVTGKDGVVTLDDVPEGAVDVAVWHSQQLVEQPVLHAQQTATPTNVVATLNFTPRQRR